MPTRYPKLTSADQLWIDGKMLQAFKADQAGDHQRAQWLRDMVDPKKPIEIKERPSKAKRKTGID